MTIVAGHNAKEPRGIRIRRSGAIAASLLAHVVALALIGLAVPKMIVHESPQFRSTDVWLMPRLTLNRDVSPAMHRATTAAPSLSSPRKAAPVLQAPSPILAAPTVKTAPNTAPGATGAQVHGPPAPVQVGAEQGGDVQEALRTSVGCDFDKTVHLTPAEHERCNQHYGEVARKAPNFNGIDPVKRAGYEAQVEADERRRANRTGPVQELVVPCDGEGSNLGGGCLPDSAMMHFHPH